ncbi:MAG: transcription-repair coupling factor [Acetobacterales bacterium]
MARLGHPGRVTLAGAPEGFDALALARLAVKEPDRPLLHVARDDQRMSRLAAQIAFFDPAIEVLTFPAWDCLPYDRVSPRADIVGRRIATLGRLQESTRSGRPLVVVTTVNALMQRVPPRDALAGAVRRIGKGETMSPDNLVGLLERHGYVRTDTVLEPGEYAVRGGLVDVFPSGSESPLRLDFFGDEIESIRSFDPLSQRSQGTAEEIIVGAISEIPLDGDAVERFRVGYRELFGAVTEQDALYESVSAGRHHPGIEHWLPLFYERLATLPEYLPGAAVTLDHQAEEARDARQEMIAEHYAARLEFGGGASAEASSELRYNPLTPDRLYVEADGWDAMLAERAIGQFSPFAAPDTSAAVDLGARPGRGFGDVRADPNRNIYQAVSESLAVLEREGRMAAVAAGTGGSRDRLATLLADHGAEGVVQCDTWAEVAAAWEAGQVPVATLPMESGFTTDAVAILTEEDILGQRLVRAGRRRKSDQALITTSELSEGDLVVHAEHGIGRYDGLSTLQVDSAPHDCLKLSYAGNDRLYVPVENIETLSRYGSESAGVQLDRLGGAAWQARKSRLKERLRETADELIAIAARRTVHRTEPIVAAEGSFAEFCARFPYSETEDQQRAIDETLSDLSTGHPMDRLICGDAGFGKTEVALRAAFMVAMAGLQVAIVVPTTLLCRQHFETVRERFAGFPIRIEQLSRLVPPKKTAEVKQRLAKGEVDLIVGTHALLAKSVTFDRLGLLVVDEEQHFGVSQKERMKQLRAEVHVLTLSATPIPRTLQLALAGVRELSLISTAPVDRLAVRTFVLPFDPVVVREAILRERFRGGQTFYVCPRIQDLNEVARTLRELVPEAKVAAAHGRLSPRALEDTMIAFSQGAYDVLLATNIVESGLDLPSVNTMIIHRADMFGLGQLYQLRGRIGRSKVRGYAYLTLPPRRVLTPAAEKRLNVMQALDTLGVGFSVASHDMDIRGAGNLLGEEQSGHIREVGIELYQHMLEEAVAAARSGEGPEAAAQEWSPQISIGAPVLIPEEYVADLSVRLGLYRRIAGLRDTGEIDSIAAEMTDRFGTIPDAVHNLLKIVEIKQLCRAAHVERVESGPKGALVTFRNNQFPDPGALVDFINRQAGSARVRPDHRLVFQRDWHRDQDRITGLKSLMQQLSGLAAQG